MWKSQSVGQHFLILFLKVSTVEELLISSGIISHTFELKNFSDFRPYLMVFVLGFMKSICVWRLKSINLREKISNIREFEIVCFTLYDQIAKDWMLLIPEKHPALILPMN